MSLANSNISKRGMTLVEVVLACGIFAIIVVFSIQVLGSNILLNRTTAMQIAANNAVRAQIEELMTVSRDNIGGDEAGDMAKAAIYYYANNFKDQKIDVGPRGQEKDRVSIEDGNKLVYYFSLPEPGDNARLTLATGQDPKGKRVVSAKAVGRMVIYLTELDVESAYQGGNPEWNVMWKDIGKGHPDVSSVEKGFDLNRDGKINDLKLDGTPRGTVSLRDAENPKTELDILQAPVDISVTFYKDTAHTQKSYELRRRVIVM